MGSLSKRLGQLATLSLESDSSKILRTIRPNKVPNTLSQKLDTTLKDSHDMRVFGLGTLASMANRERYARFTHSLYGIYSTMEDELDQCIKERDVNENSNNNNNNNARAVAFFWERHSDILRRSEKLKSDLNDVSSSSPIVNHEELSFQSYSNETKKYMTAIRSAGRKDRSDGGGRLLGHAYTRYLADLMGGQVLGTPTRMALSLDDGTPRQYSFMFPVDRKCYVESIYQDLNDAGDLMKVDDDDDDDDVKMLDDVVAEARAAFQYNVKVYSEEPLLIDSMIGLKNISFGWAMSR